MPLDSTTVSVIGPDGASVAISSVTVGRPDEEPADTTADAPVLPARELVAQLARRCAVRVGILARLPSAPGDDAQPQWQIQFVPPSVQKAIEQQTAALAMPKTGGPDIFGADGARYVSGADASVREFRVRLARDLNEGVPLYTEDQHVEIAVRPPVAAAHLELRRADPPHALPAEADQVARIALVDDEAEVAAIFADPEDSRAHGKDERIEIRRYFEALEFWRRMVEELAG